MVLSSEIAGKGKGWRLEERFSCSLPQKLSQYSRDIEKVHPRLFRFRIARIKILKEQGHG